MVATGSRSSASTLRRAPALPGRLLLLCVCYLRTVLQLLEAAIGNHISRINPLYGSLARIRNPCLNVADLCGSVLYQVNKCRLPIVLDGGIWNQRDSLK